MVSEKKGKLRTLVRFLSFYCVSSNNAYGESAISRKGVHPKF